MVTIKQCDICGKECHSLLIGVYVNEELKDKPLLETSYVEGEPYSTYTDFDFCSWGCFDRWYKQRR